MKFKCLALDGETTNKYICINPDNKNYLACMEMMPTNNESTYVFNINNCAHKSTTTVPAIRAKILCAMYKNIQLAKTDNHNLVANGESKY